MGCLDDLIGIKGCGNSPHSFYLNDLTGITIADFDKAISIESRTAKEKLQEILAFSTKLVEAEVDDIFAEKYQLRSIIENNTVGYYYDNKVLQPVQVGKLTGYEVRIDQTPHLSFDFSSLRLFVDYTGVVPVYVYDLIQGKLLDTINVNAVAGEIVSVDGLDKTYATNKQRLRLFIGYDATSIQSYQTNYSHPYATGGAYEMCNIFGCTYAAWGGHIYFRSAQIGVADQKIANNLESNTISGGAGLSINYSLSCSFTEILCNMRKSIALPILYKAGAMVMQELKHSKRLTGVVTVYAESHDELMQKYDNEYRQKMSDILLNATIPNSMCFRCTPKVKTAVTFP